MICNSTLFEHACSKIKCLKSQELGFVEQFLNFENALKRISPDERKKLGVAQFLCLLGTYNAFETALVEFDLSNKPDDQKMRILKCLLLNNNRSLFHAIKKMEMEMEMGMETAVFSYINFSRVDFSNWDLSGLDLHDFIFAGAEEMKRILQF